VEYISYCIYYIFKDFRMTQRGNFDNVAEGVATVATLATVATARFSEGDRAGGVRVSRHAIARYRERVADGPDEMIIAALSSVAIQALAQIGRGAVILSCGARVIVENGTVLTVLPIGQRVMNWHRYSATENF
jgi:hypothetical protein